MEKIVQQGILYDFYGELLTDHQKQVYEGLVYENLSLGEIADDQGVSRQAVHDLIKRTDKILLGYEEKLGLAARFGQIKKRIESIDQELSTIENDYPEEIKQLEQIRLLCKEIKDIM